MSEGEEEWEGREGAEGEGREEEGEGTEMGEVSWRKGEGRRERKGGFRGRGKG